MARRKTGDKKVAGKKNRTATGEVSNVQAHDHSIAFDQLHVGGDVGGDIRIGHTIGYTADQVSVLLKQITTTLQPKPFDGRCPYKGLEVFEEEDAELFFGRERLVVDLIGRVKESRTVFITGPSGSGKSSLVRAGLIHDLKQGKINALGSERWLYETMKPGREPIKDLALAFSRLKSPELEDYFLAHSSETDILHKCAESVLSGRKDQRFVLFIDQFEEVFTQINQEEERVAFINMLAHAGTIENGRVIVLFAMRSDFVSNCATYPALNELLSQEFRQIGAMQPEELVSAIALPARHVGLPIEDELIARIINDMKGEPGALPLMQFALKDLFDSQQEKGGVIALKLDDYLKHGGIHKSLERHADATFAKLSESEQELARSIFSGLIEIGRGTQDTKRTALFDELVPANTKTEDVGTIVQKLADARLIITDEQAGKDTVTISHEKLIEAWPWLKKLVHENREVIALQNEIASDAKEWKDHNHDVSYLYSGARLANVREQLEARRLILNDLAQTFVSIGIEIEENQRVKEEARRQKELDDARRLADMEAQRAEIEKQRAEEQTRSAANLRKRSLYLTIALIMAIISLGVAAWFTVESRKQTNIALARQLAAQAQSINATNNSRQIIAVLLAIQSMNIFPSSEASQVLLNNNLAAYLIARMANDSPVKSVAFSPDGKYVASGSDDHNVRIWEVATRNEVARMPHDDWVNSVAFSPDGKYIASGSGDRSLRIWEVATSREVVRMTHIDYVLCVAFSPDGKYVASGGTIDDVRIWEVATGSEIASLPHNEPVTSITFSPDGKYMASGSYDYSVRIWEIPTGQETARLNHANGVNSVAFSPDGKYVVSGSSDYSARIWDVATGSEINRMLYNDIVTSVAFSPDSKYVVAGSQDKTARVWEVNTGKEIARMSHDNWVTSVAFGPDGKFVVSGSDDKSIRVWSASLDTDIARLVRDEQLDLVAYSPDGKYVASGGEDHNLRLWEIATGKEVAHLTEDTYQYNVAFSPDGKYIVDSLVRIWEISTGREVARFLGAGSVAFSPDSKYVAAGGQGNTILIGESATGREIAHLNHDWTVNSVAFSPNGKYLASGSSDETARVWEIATLREIASMQHADTVSSVAFSPDGKYVASASRDNSVRVWEAKTGDEIARMIHDDWVYSVAFSPDGKYLVSESKDDSFRIWEVASVKEVARMTTVSSLGGFIAFSPDGKYFVSESNMWMWRPQDLITDACSRAPRNLTRIEWERYIGDAMKYEAICPDLPIEPEPTPTAAP